MIEDLDEGRVAGSYMGVDVKITHAPRLRGRPLWRMGISYTITMPQEYVLQYLKDNVLDDGAIRAEWENHNLDLYYVHRCTTGARIFGAQWFWGRFGERTHTLVKKLFGIRVVQKTVSPEGFHLYEWVTNDEYESYWGGS